ncbi:alpha-amylase family glycosyl hydrolase [Planctomycetota bacterium]
MMELEPSKRPGMGSFPYEGGATFRVWAPHAREVFVLGTFNNWQEDRHALASEGNGLWSADVLEAKIGDHYKYRLITDQGPLLRIDPYARETLCSSCDGIIHDPDFNWGEDRFVPPAHEALVIYEMHVGTFHVKQKGKPGSFLTALEKLAYLKDLGINCIEVMPVMEFQGDFSWGYNPALIFSIENAYGGPLAFKQFIKAAHDQGMAVILDVVYNHLGPGDLDLWQFDGWQENDKGGIYFYNDHRSQTPWGETRPDYGRGEVRQYLRDNALMWLEEYRLDGLRWDATAFIRNIQGTNDPAFDLPEGWSLMQWINEQIKQTHPQALSIAEDVRGNAALTALASLGGAGFDAQWNGLFVHEVRQVLAAPDKSALDLGAICRALEFRYDQEAFKRIIYTESHDEVANGKARVPQQISSDDPGSWTAKKLSTLGAALVFSTPGIPMIFQGQEFLEDEWFRDEDPLDWAKLDRYAGIHRLYRDLIRLRRNLDRNTQGLRGPNIHLFHVNHQDKVLAFKRSTESVREGDVVVVANFAAKEQLNYRVGLPRSGTWAVRLNTDHQDYDASFSGFGPESLEAIQEAYDGLPCSATLDMGPFSVLILS